MSYKSIFLALVLVTLSGCAVYGGNTGYGHRGYDRGHSTTYYQVQRQPVYVVPQPQRYNVYRDHGHHYEHRRQPTRYYVPAPQPRYYHSAKSPHYREHRVDHSQARWEGRRERDDDNRQQRHRQQRHDQQRGAERHSDERRGWERQRNQ